MEVYRISKEKYAGNLHSSGTENRWNRKGQYVIYTGSSRSLSTLELVVHRSSILRSSSYKIMIISVSDRDDLVKQLQLSDLPKNWNQLESYPRLQEIGSDWYENRESLILKVPSAIIPKEYNYVINTVHPEFKSNVTLVRNEDFFWDERLF